MIIATLVTLIFLGGAAGSLFPKNFNKQLKSAVENKSERKEIESIVEDIDDTFKEFNKEAGKSMEEIIELGTNHDIDPMELQKRVDALITRRAAMQKKAIDARMTMPGKMTREQWAVAFADSE